jgi:hypothetical protein
LALIGFVGCEPSPAPSNQLRYRSLYTIASGLVVLMFIPLFLLLIPVLLTVLQPFAGATTSLVLTAGPVRVISTSHRPSERPAVSFRYRSLVRVFIRPDRFSSL